MLQNHLLRPLMPKLFAVNNWIKKEQRAAKFLKVIDKRTNVRYNKVVRFAT